MPDRPNLLAWFVLVVLSFLPSVARSEEPARKGALLIVGGGTMPEALSEKFMELAGGAKARLVVIPTASESADRKEEEDSTLQPWRKFRPASLTLLHTRSRKTADDPAFVRQSRRRLPSGWVAEIR